QRGEPRRQRQRQPSRRWWLCPASRDSLGPTRPQSSLRRNSGLGPSISRPATRWLPATVISQDPASGSSVAEGSPVKLVISSEPQNTGTAPAGPEQQPSSTDKKPADS